MNIQFFVLSGMLLLDKILTEDGRFSKEGKGEEEVDKWERGGRRGEGRQERGGEEAGEGRQEREGGGREAGIGRCRRVGKQWGG